jgi:hypothetical protein
MIYLLEYQTVEPAADSDRDVRGYYGQLPVELNLSPAQTLNEKHEVARKFLSTDVEFVTYLDQLNLTVDDLALCVWSDENDENVEWF